LRCCPHPRGRDVTVESKSLPITMNPALSIV